MPYISIKDKDIYYKQCGTGEPVVFLSGVMMSTNSWSPFIKTVSQNYNMIMVDLLDQGKSHDGEDEYTVETQAQILQIFLDKLNLGKVSLMGMSYGGKVAQVFALNYQDRVKSLILSNTDSYTTNFMKDIAKSWDYAAVNLNGDMFSTITMPYMYSYGYYEENYDDILIKQKVLSKVLNEKWYQRLERNLNSAQDYNILDRIENIKVPTLIISSEFDIITPLRYQQLIHERIEGSKWAIIKGTGHAAMYEKPDEYISIIMKFLKETIGK